MKPKIKRKILVLHGDRQTGDLFITRIASLKRKLLKPRNYDLDSKNSNVMEGNSAAGGATHYDKDNFQIELEAPNGPFTWKLDPTVHVKGTNDSLTDEQKRENDLMRTWWNRDGNEYGGLTDSLEIINDIWDNDSAFEGILGFSRGARLAHLVTSLHEASSGKLFPNLRYVILASGYGHVPLPTNFPPKGDRWDEHFHDYDPNQSSVLSVPSMHIMGTKDKLIPLEHSRALLPSYVDPSVHEHDGGHHIPMRAANVRAILQFIDSLPSQKTSTKNNIAVQTFKQTMPDEEHATAQEEECDSLAMIFPDEFKLLSATDGVTIDEFGSERIKYVHPIKYTIQLNPPMETLKDDEDTVRLWPTKDISLKIEYTVQYPDSAPNLSLAHDMNLLEFKLCQERACLVEVNAAAEAELGMPSVMSCIYKAREFFEEGGLSSSLQNHNEGNIETQSDNDNVTDTDTESRDQEEMIISNLLKPASKERVKACVDEGLKIANAILKVRNIDDINSDLQAQGRVISGKGGNWKYTVGLVGKPSAGKSTFFNAASAFARQRGGDEVGDDGIAIGGATMAPHPFTTIDPNVGFCLVPAPSGSCPEDNSESLDNASDGIGCTHGRDSFGRRLLPVMLKDVAGLVPGAYQGRGRGNKFLDDLTDADVLIHVLDASGTADAEGNTVVTDYKDTSATGSDPLNDLDWIFNELIQWVFFNLMSKWDAVLRKGQTKLAGMFSGYKQNQSFVYDVLLATEKYLNEHEGRDRALEHLDTWDEGDLYRLVAAFLGARFPVALALNKNDIPSAKKFCKDIVNALPIHGAHSGTQMSAHKEMLFVKEHIFEALGHKLKSTDKSKTTPSSPPHGVWNCLQAAMKMREPVLVFPVSDMETYEPISTMMEYAVNNPSLPNAGMVGCLITAGGSPPTLWDKVTSSYNENTDSKKCQALRDVLVMKPGSTIEDVFLVLKGNGALGGEFVRAEAVGCIGDKPKLVKKDDILGKHNRILKIMTTKRREWQKKL